jgi:hypothetical protein
MDNVMDLAHQMYPDEEKFLAWLAFLVAEAELEEKATFSTGEVFPMLGHSQRVYQIWEKRDDFPKPTRDSRGNRAYRPQDVVAIAFWKWNRKDARKREGGE